ncbi:TIR domain-containing protein [Flavobacterium succinicans]|uniref:TIR domain-containing protein n=1 Tax=Flavobacterium succinicans TaxID=29536 RepID=A0A1I5A665_9FLAO|nr:toll/interleukin-1 receptor domain-containing protein [Flavobacterium succinicans]SFN57945.1 TIR domain-containing protein [Flavobacterium succinicans]
MSGFTKNQSNKVLEKSKKEFSNYLTKISILIPLNYDFEIIISLIHKYYPYEWRELNEISDYYKLKDKKLNVKNIKIRHIFPTSVEIIRELKIVKNILSKEFRSNHKLSFDIEKYKLDKQNFNIERLPKIKIIKDKIEKAKLKSQELEPNFLDKLIGIYEQKNTSQKDRVYIFNELERYYCDKTLFFFRKKVDTEYNFQLREMAFKHLQSLKHFAVLRSQKYMRIPSNNKKCRQFLKNIYSKEHFNIKSIPQELEYRIENSKEQKLKTYHFFISHSSNDFKQVQSVISYLNLNNKNVYCDWINDESYLKRNLIGESTISVIKKRLEQSDNILFIKSENSLASKWVKYELNYFQSLKKEIFEIDIEELKSNKFNFKKINDYWFVDPNYKEINLLN